jgi:hypothetical protein
LANRRSERKKSASSSRKAIAVLLRSGKLETESTMNAHRNLKRIIAGALLSGGAAVVGAGLSAVVAQANPRSMSPATSSAHIERNLI